MFAPRSIVTRSLALWLSACFVWIFIACVSLCSLDEERQSQTSPALSSVATAADGSHDCEHCPIMEAPSFVLPERQSSVRVSQTRGDIRESFAPLSPTNHALRLPARLLIPPSTSDPPFERLGILRI